jgi:hypothetical protein
MGEATTDCPPEPREAGSALTLRPRSTSRTLSLRLASRPSYLATLGLASGASYSVSEALNGQSLGSKTGSALSVSGIDVALGPESPGVVVLEKLP